MNKRDQEHSKERHVQVKEITSAQNPLIKQLINLRQKPKHRRTLGQCVIEGLREVKRAVEFGYQIETIFYRPDLINRLALESSLNIGSPLQTPLPSLYVECAPHVFERVAYRTKVPNVVVIASQKTHHLAELRSQLSQTPLLLVIEGVEKPGNLGAMLRTADGLGVCGVLLCDCVTDLYHPNTLRNSLGGAFSLPIACCSTQEGIEWLRQHKISICVTALSAMNSPHQVDFTRPTALIVGSEDQGVSSLWIDNAHHHILISMRGVVDSLNVSTSAAIVLYEATRQRMLLEDQPISIS